MCKEFTVQSRMFIACVSAPLSIRFGTKLALHLKICAPSVLHLSVLIEVWISEHSIGMSAEAEPSRCAVQQV